MSTSTNFLQSSLGKKVTMGITGLFLISFLIVHVTINSFIFACDGGELFNMGCYFMATNPIIRIVEIVLFLGLIIHAVQGFKLTLANKSARPVAYAVTPGNVNSKWYSRSMGVLGSLLLMFIVVHLSHFWIETKEAQFGLGGHDIMTHNTYLEVVEVFSNPFNVVIYLLGVGSLGFHLAHGFQSAFQTMGWNHPKYTPLIKKAGTAFSIIITALFALMPLCVYFGCIGGGGCPVH